MSNHIFLNCVLKGAVCAGFLASAANATVIIDNFSQTTFAYPPTPGVVRTTPGATTINETGLSPANVVGSSRTSMLTGESFLAPPDDNVAYRISGVALNATYSSTDGANGMLRLLYDANGGDLNLDLSGETQFDVHFNAFDFGNAIAMPVMITVFDGINTAVVTKMLTAPGSQDLFYSLSDFTGATPALNLASINSIQFDFNPATAQDFTFDLLQATNQTPEPASFALIGTGLIGFGMLIRRRKA